jgi:hypothetical protein
MSESQFVELCSGEAGLVLDARNFPILIVTVFGEADQVVVRRIFEWRAAMFERAKASGTRAVVVADIRPAKRPPPLIRKLAAELIDANPMPAEQAMPSFLVLDNALLRGALTALQWITTRKTKHCLVKDLQDALAGAMGALIEVGLDPPSLDPQAYPVPPKPVSDTEMGAVG